ncbi:HNH endonuclease [Nocardioidaceae bacterium]|nr:HNH endonuclease [Nocardioidaceae bacterium]
MTSTHDSRERHGGPGGSGGSGTPADLLAAVRAGDRAARAGEVARARAVLAWLDAHPAESIRDAAGHGPDTGGALHGERALLLGGPGTPMIAEFCVADLGAALGTTTDSARILASDLLELRHRLPATWARVEALDLPLWRARRIATRTTVLDLDRAGAADRWLAPKAHRLGVPALDRTLTGLLRVQQAEAELVREAGGLEALALTDATTVHERLREQTRALSEAAAKLRNQQHVRIALPVQNRSGSPTAEDLAGLAWVDGRIDALDAADLDTSLDLIATRLAATAPAHTSEGCLRAQALGVLARGELVLPYDTSDADTAERPTDGAERIIDREHRTRATRELVLHVHLSAATLTRSTDGLMHAAGLATIESGPVRLVDEATVRAWAHAALADTGPTAGQTRLTIRPVLDLNEEHASTAYAPGPRLREQVILRDRTCVFPHCHRPARAADLDHIDPWHDPPDEPHRSGGSQPPQTCTDNLAALCRFHHRLKTHSGWTYRRTGPPTSPTYEWRSPTGRTYRRGPDGDVDDLGPRQPPGPLKPPV